MNEVIVKDIVEKLDYDDIIMCRLAIKHILEYEECYSLERGYLKTLEKLGGSL